MRRTALMFMLAGLVGALVAVPIAVYASHQFADVPNTNPFHDDIDWLADAGVTKGCGPSEYCPKDNVTREQMAAFMRRLSGNDPGVAPSVNAGQLNGLTSQQLAPRAVHAATVFPQRRAGTSIFPLKTPKAINAPVAGTILITGSGMIQNSDTGDDASCSLYVNDQLVDGSIRAVDLDGSVSQREVCATSVAKDVPAGVYTIALRMTNLDDTTVISDLSVWAVWVPFDGNGNTP